MTDWFARGTSTVKSDVLLEFLADSCVCALLVGSGSLEAVVFPVNGLPQYTFHTVPGDVDKQFRTSLAWT